MPEAADKPRRSRDSVSNTLIVSIGLSLIASVLVASTAIVLKPVQVQNEERYRRQIILDVAGLYVPGESIEEQFRQIETRMVDLESGDVTDEVTADGFDPIAAAKDPRTGVDIPGELDLANIRQRARYSPVYFVRAGDEVTQIILPVYGSGLWSTMYGFLAVAPDGNTIEGLRFYEHAETPGLGDQIDKPDWRAQWSGKEIYGAGGAPRIEVVRGRVDPASPNVVHQVDGLAGATLTGRGITALVRYWTGPHGFGPFLSKQNPEATGDD